MKYKNEIKLIFGDSLIKLKRIKTKSVNMIFSDPPYFLSNGGYSVLNGKRVSVDKGAWDKSKSFKENYKFYKSWIKQSKRILTENGSIWISGTYHSIYICGFILQELGFTIINDISWFKPNAAPNIGCRCFTASHETLIWAKLGKKNKHVFNYKNLKHEEALFDKLKAPNKQMRSVWNIPTTPKSEKCEGKHPTQKPLKLMERIIKASTNENDLILDPFMGSGTTGVASKKLNRKFIGIENDINSYELAKKRIFNG